jgi:hypothetical protein
MYTMSVIYNVILTVGAALCLRQLCLKSRDHSSIILTAQSTKAKIVFEIFKEVITSQKNLVFFSNFQHAIASSGSRKTSHPFQITTNHKIKAIYKN